jgi:hypothetical protein
MLSSAITGIDTPLVTLPSPCRPARLDEMEGALDGVALVGIEPQLDLFSNRLAHLENPLYVPLHVDPTLDLERLESPADEFPSPRHRFGRRQYPDRDARLHAITESPQHLVNGEPRRLSHDIIQRHVDHGERRRVVR